MRCSDNSKTQKLAGQLLALEGGENAIALSDVKAVTRVCDKLRRPIATLAGAAGFRSLLERALTLTKKECPILNSWEVQQDGSLLGLDGEGAPWGAILIAQFIGLMITFIGESLTLRLLQDAWPNLPYSELCSERSEST